MRRSISSTGIEPPGRWLFFVDDDGAVLRYRVGGDEGKQPGRVRIGRDTRNDIYFDHPQVPVQALVVVEREGVDVVKVFEAARVHLNGVLVTGMHRLYSGDRLHVGDHHFLYARDDTPPDLALGLTVIFADEVIKAVVLRQTRVIIGRSGDLIVDDPSVSERHAVIEAYAEDGLFLREVAPGLGTWVDGTVVAGRVALTDGATVQVGRVSVAVRILPADGLGLLIAPRKKPERIGGQFIDAAADVKPVRSQAALSNAVPVTEIGSLASMGLASKGARSSSSAEVADAARDDDRDAQGDDEFDQDATGRYHPHDRSRPAHWSTGTTPPPGPVASAPAAQARASSAALRPVRPARRPVDEGPSVQVRSDLLTTPKPPPSRVVDGPLRPSANAPAVLPAMVATVRPNLHDADTATLDTRGVPDMIEAHYAALGQPVPAWARAEASSSPPPPVMSRAVAEPADRYRPSQVGRNTGGHQPRASAQASPMPAPPPPPPPRMSRTSPPINAQLTVGLAPIPEPPRLDAPPPPPVVQGYSHHDPNRAAAAEAPPPRDTRPRGATDDAARHHRRRAVDDSPRYNDDDKSR